MAAGERCARCGHVVPYAVKQRCIADGGYCETAVDGGDIARSSSPKKAGARRAPARARARKPAKKGSKKK